MCRTGSTSIGISPAFLQKPDRLQVRSQALNAALAALHRQRLKLPAAIRSDRENAEAENGMYASSELESQCALLLADHAGVTAIQAHQFGMGSLLD